MVETYFNKLGREKKMLTNGVGGHHGQMKLFFFMIIYKKVLESNQKQAESGGNSTLEI